MIFLGVLRDDITRNHAIIFSRGSIIQCIDANQGGYFEQMLLLPCALGEFRQEGPGLNPRIVPGPFPKMIYGSWLWFPWIPVWTGLNSQVEILGSHLGTGPQGRLRGTHHQWHRIPGWLCGWSWNGLWNCVAALLLLLGGTHALWAPRHDEQGLVPWEGEPKQRVKRPSRCP